MCPDIEKIQVSGDFNNPNSGTNADPIITMKYLVKSCPGLNVIRTTKWGLDPITCASDLEIEAAFS